MSSSTPGWTEPESPAAKSKYPHNHATQTESGHSFELDDTPGAERIRMQHRSGTFYEMHPDGDQVVKIKGKSYEIVLSDKNVSISGDCNITVNGNCNMHVKGDYNMQVDGNYTQKIAGNIVQLNDNEMSSDMRTTIGDVNINASGNIYLRAGADSQVIVNSDLTVNGDIGCNQSIKALGNITATENIMGLAGVRTTGSLLVGPIATGPTIPAPLVNFVTPLMSVLGPVAVVGATTITGETVITGMTNVIGILDVTGNILTQGDVIGASGATLDTHIHVVPGIMSGPSSTVTLPAVG